jgi:phage gpG-like protein
MIITIDPTQARARLTDLAAELRDLTPAMKLVATQLAVDVADNFAQGGVFPQPWQPSLRVIRQGGQTLVDHGLLRRSFTAGQEFGPDSASISSTVVYAGIHQHGGMVTIPARVQPMRPAPGGGAMLQFAKRSWAERRKTGTIRIAVIPAHTIRIPARPMLPVRDGELQPSTAAYVRLVITRHLGLTA